MEGVTPDSLLALHAAGYRTVIERLGAGTVLDVGCGQGFESARFLAADRSVVGIDYNADAVAFARSRWAGDGLSVGQMNALSLGLAGGSFRWACSSHLIEHFHDPESHVRELARVLADDGTAFFLTPNAPADFENPFHIHLFEPDELRAVLERHFHSVTVQGLDPIPAVKADFTARRVKANKVLRLDVLEAAPPDPAVVVHRRLHPDAPAGLQIDGPGGLGRHDRDHRRGLLGDRSAGHHHHGPLRHGVPSPSRRLSGAPACWRWG